MTDRKKLSLGNVAARSEEREAADAAKAWNISPARAEQLKERARDMRRHPSEAEKALWARIGDKQLGYSFNRQVVMGSAIVDFACKTRWLVVETGGTDGAEATIAALSDRKLTDVGVRVLRFSEQQVLEDTDAVAEAIKAELDKPFERPRIGGSAPRKSDGEKRFHRSRQ
jgi:very-short-patch-repair endonuclease